MNFIIILWLLYFLKVKLDYLITIDYEKKEWDVRSNLHKPSVHSPEQLPKNYQKIDLSSQFKLNGLVYILVDSLVNNFTTKKQLLNKYNSTLTSNKSIISTVMLSYHII